MPTKMLAGTAALVMLVCSAAAAEIIQQPNEAAALQQFGDRVAAYYALHQSVAWRAPLQVCADPEEIVAGSTALGDAIRGSRRDAHQGDLFTGEVSSIFRTRIHAALASHGMSEADLVADIGSEAPIAPADLTVNRRFDWGYGALMPAVLIDVLPPLPEALQYRLVGTDLVLIDVDAGLIVDVLTAALVVD